MGTLRKKIARQDDASTSHPPSTGPSAVVSADYRITTLTLSDGRTLSGVIAGKNDRTVTLRQPTSETTLEKTTITKQETTSVSLMPEGLLTAFQPDQVRDLIAYLMHPTQVEK